MNTFKALITVVLLFTAMTISAQSRDFSFSNNSEREGLTMESNTRSGIQMRHTLKQISLVNITDNGYTGDIIQGGTGLSLPANEGDPDLPSFSRFVAVPNGASAHIEMGYRSMTTIAHVDVMPAAPLKFDTDDSPNTHEKNMDVYGKNAFFPEQPVSVSEPFSLRGVQTVAVTVTPYQYNPVTKELRVYDDLQFGVSFDGGNGEFGDYRLRSPYWDPILMQNLVNYNQLPVVDYEARMQEWANHRPEGCEYLIVIPNNEGFRQYANQLADYRIKQGIITEVKSLAEMGCTTTAMMKAYFHNAYNNWEIAPVAVLLLADHNTNMAQGIPAESTYHSQNYGNCITDNGYADVTGDNLPEMAFSRLVAANANQAQMMVSKQIEYEYTNPNMSPSSYDQPITALGWQTERWFQICSEVVGGYWRSQGKHPVRINAIYDGTPGSIWSSNQNTTMVVNYFGPNGTGYIPSAPNELGGWTGGTGPQVVQAVNNGCMLLQHRDHGYYQGWGEPDFSNSHVSQMNNVGKMTFVNTINCQTGTFDHSPECLIETFMRRTSNGQNAGAVGCIGPTQTSYSFVNDTYAWGMYDQYDPQFLPTYGPYANYEGNWRPAFGNVAGKYFLQQSSWPYNTQNKAITHKMFTAHCDAFLTLYTQVPQTMTVDHPSQISVGSTSVTVTAPAGAVIALTRDNDILAVATATGSSQNISIPLQPSNSRINIVGTKQDYLRYVGHITVISEPHLSLIEVTPNNVNDNGQLEYGAQSTFDMTIKNVGDLDANNATATLTTNTPTLVTITNSTATLPALGSEQSIDLEDAYGITVANNVANNDTLGFTLTFDDGSHQWTSEFFFRTAAPSLNIGEAMLINDSPGDKGMADGNGRLDPGENAMVKFSFSNEGDATANNVSATLMTTRPNYISILTPTINFTAVDPGQTIELTYAISVSAATPLGEAVDFKMTIVTGDQGYGDEKQFSHRIGLDLANFEQGLEGLEWENDPQHPWVVSTSNPYSGSQCLQSGTISHNETSTLSIQYNVESDDEIHFCIKTSSQTNGDFLRFYIDNTMIQEWSGTNNWQECIFPVAQGEHTFRWAFERNASGSGGNNRVWIDEILFPAKHVTFACIAGADQDLCMEEVQLEAYALGFEALHWTTNGDGNFSATDILNPTYTPGEQDLNNKTVVLSLTATNSLDEEITDQVTIHFHEATSIEMDEEGDLCENGSFDLSATVTESGLCSWDTEGDGSFSNINDPNATYTPGPQDIANGSVSLKLKATSPFGCGDAEQSFQLNIHRIESTEFDMKACVSYNWNGIEYSEEGDYEQTLQSIYGCDSIVTMHFTLVDAYQTETEINACYSYDWASETLIESGDYEHTFTSIHGCDSTVMLHLTINELSTTEFDMEACDSYDWNGTSYSESGHYQQILSNMMGCDSIVTLHLTINTAPVIEAINGEAEVDVRLTPSSQYMVSNLDASASCTWSIEPEEAGTIVGEGTSAVINWSDTFKGLAIVTAEGDNSCGHDTKALTVNVKNSTDVDEHSISANIYPNPTNGSVTIQAEGLKRITVSNALGQIVIDEETEGRETHLNMSHLAVGTYLVRIQTLSGSTIKRINVIR